jgi:hypothetical protein
MAVSVIFDSAWKLWRRLADHYYPPRDLGNRVTIRGLENRTPLDNILVWVWSVSCPDKAV